jgi:hypothetical protein
MKPESEASARGGAGRCTVLIEPTLEARIEKITREIRLREPRVVSALDRTVLAAYRHELRVLQTEVDQMVYRGEHDTQRQVPKASARHPKPRVQNP